MRKLPPQTALNFEKKKKNSIGSHSSAVEAALTRQKSSEQ